MRIVRAVRPDAKFVTDFWQEGARLVKEGYLKIPPEVIPVWADTGYGYLQDNGQVSAGQGAYYHVAMMNNRSNQLTEMVPVERIYSELGRYIKAKATEYILLNTSDIRPVSMTTEAVMDIAWKGIPASGDSRGIHQRRVLPAVGHGGVWSEGGFAVVEMYKEYFNAPAHFSFNGGQPLSMETSFTIPSRAR